MKPKRSGIIRRFDMLGRIVVPKEIRQVLRLKEGDPMEIGICGESIVMERYQPLLYLEDTCEKHLRVLAGNCSFACAILSTEHVLASRGITLPEAPCLAKRVRMLIEEQKTYLNDDADPLYLFEDSRYRIHALYPVGTKEQPSGAVILLHYRNVSPEELACARQTADTLTILLKEE